MKRAIFWFRQDLRTGDNRGWLQCIKENDAILPIFILDKNQIDSFGGLENKKFGFLREALENLDSQIYKMSKVHLNIFYDTPENIIPSLVDTYNISSIHANKSYSEYGSKKRDPLIRNILEQKKVDFFLHHDFLLVEPEDIPQRKVFTPYFKLWKNIQKDTMILPDTQFCGIVCTQGKRPKDFILHEKHPYFTLDFGKDRLKNHIQNTYQDTRNYLDTDGTSKISPYLRFGIFSIREIFQAAKNNESFLSELAWRDFWQHIYHYFPEGKFLEFQEKRRHIVWQKNNILFEKFIQGKTGYPIIDASIQQLLTTNRMHGRSRMIVASFLTKDLHIDWREGEKFFKKYLLDYDENMNIGNWQWSASVGADPKPLRIFNPMLQSEKFDKNALFIKKYLPELKDQKISDIHNPCNGNLEYISPIIHHTIEQKITKEIYKNHKKDLE